MTKSKKSIVMHGMLLCPLVLGHCAFLRANADVLKTLTPREEKVLRLRFGLEDGRPRTLEEVGRDFGVTRERVRQIEAKAIRKLQALPLSYLDRHSTGDLVSRMTADATLLSDGLLLGFTQFFSGVIAILVTLAFMISKSLLITAMVLVLTPVSFFIAKWIASRSFQMFLRQSEARGQQTALIEEMIGNQKLVQAFGYEARSLERFAAINQKLQEYSQKAVFYSSLTNPSTRFVNNVIYALVAFAGAFLILAGNLTVGGLSVLLSYANQYMKPFNDISSVVTELQNALACAARVFELLDADDQVPEVENASVLQALWGLSARSLDQVFARLAEGVGLWFARP